MSSLTDDQWSQACADYQEAKAELAAILRRQHDAEQARHRTGVDEGTVAQCEADYVWCKSLIVACGEVIKGRTLAELMEV